MNRTQRRAQMRAEKRSPMAQQIETANFTMRHGHTDDRVIVVFPKAIPNLQLTAEQAEDFISAMQNSIQKLRAHVEAKAKGANGG